MNSWSLEDQSIQKISENLHTIKPSKVSNIRNGIKRAILSCVEENAQFDSNEMQVEDNENIITSKIDHTIEYGTHCRIIFTIQHQKEKNYDVNEALELIDNEGDIEISNKINIVDIVQTIIDEHNNEVDGLSNKRKIKFCEVILLFVINEKRDKSKSTSSNKKSKNEESSTEENPPLSKRPKRQAALNFLKKQKESSNQEQEEEMNQEFQNHHSDDILIEDIPKSSIVHESNLLRVEVNFVLPSEMKNALLDLCISLNNLNVMNINQIPLKVESKTASTMYYKTTVLYPNNNLEKKYTRTGHPHHGFKLGTNFWKSTDREIQTYWRPFDKRINVDTLPCSSVHRISPYDSSSFISRSLFMHLQENRPLILAQPDSDNELIMTHALLLHGNFIYVHILCNDTLVNAFESDIYGSDTLIRKYRLQAFLEMVEMNNLPLEGNNELIFIENNEKTVLNDRLNHISYPSTVNLERITKYFPFYEDDTILFSSRQYDSLRNLTQPIRNIILQENITESDFETVIKCLDRLDRATKDNEVKLFLNTKNSVQKRRDLYNKLWKEIHFVFDQFKLVSANHQKLASFVSTLTPQDLKLADQENIQSNELSPMNQDKTKMSVEEQLAFASNELKSMCEFVLNVRNQYLLYF